MMRKLASAEMAYQERSENSEFGTTIELYNHGLVDAELTTYT